MSFNPDSDAEQESQISTDELAAMVHEVPLVADWGIEVVEIEPGAVTLKVPYQPRFVRPGETIAGPVLMALADFAAWGVLMSLDRQARMAVTTQLNINFLRRPEPGELIARASILKQGRRLGVVEIALYSGEDEAFVSHVTCTYAMPVDAG